MPTIETTLQGQFFDFLFGEQEGYVCISVAGADQAKSGWKDSFFRWPTQRNEMVDFITGVRNKNIYFGVHLLSNPRRIKANALPTNLVWADLDTADPKSVDPQPHLVIESSPDRYHAIWRMTEIVSPQLAEEYSRRMAYKYLPAGVDRSGWDLSQVLRVPFTVNYKYGSMPTVKLLRAEETLIEPHVFENIIIDEIRAASGDDDTEAPDFESLPHSDNVIYAYRFDLSKQEFFKTLFYDDPDETEADWSKLLWRLINICSEVGMSKEETFVVAAASKCNKYARDGRPIRHLWRDVVKAYHQKQAFNQITGELENGLVFPQLVDPDSDYDPTFLEDYITWASVATDGCAAYHELAGAILLSSMLADTVMVKTSFGKIVPNLWGLILGESTLTRKTTSMRLAMDFIAELDHGKLLATSGSIEGILTAVSERPDKVSIFFRDEVAGFFEEIQKKDYLAGMAETLAHLYDCPAVDHRRLRKEVITIQNPVFIYFGGGIQQRVYETVREDLFYSGFIPRFLIVSGESDLESLRPIGPPTNDNENEKRRNKLKSKLVGMQETYAKSVIVKIGDQVTDMQKKVEAMLTPEAWTRLGDIEKLLTRVANESPQSLMALPTFVRISSSMLKLAILLACTRQEPDKDYRILVTEKDVIHAALYIQKWGVHTVHMLNNSGQTFTERTIAKIMKAVTTHPGIARSELMRRHHLTSQEATHIFNTLDERGMIHTKSSGRGKRIWPV